MSANWVLARFYRESLGELNLLLGKMADGSDHELTQTDQNDINSQWSLFFADLDELLSEYEQHWSTNDIAIMENLTIRLENAVQALQNASHFVAELRWPEGPPSGAP